MTLAKQLNEEQQRLSLNGDEKLLRGKGVEADTVRKLMNYIRTNKYE